MPEHHSPLKDIETYYIHVDMTKLPLQQKLQKRVKHYLMGLFLGVLLWQSQTK